MKILKESTLSKVLLVRLYKDFQTDGYDKPADANLTRMFDGRLSKNSIEAAADILTRAGWTVKSVPSPGRYQIALKPEGRGEAERLLEHDDPECVEYFKKGNSFFDQFEGLPSPRRDEATADVDEWQPLKIDRQKPEFKAAVSKAEKALDVIRSDNGYASEMPEEREEIVRSVQAGVETLKAGSPTRQTIIALLVAPLRFVANKFVGAALGEAAKDAVAALLHWIGSIL